VTVWEDRAKKSGRALALRVAVVKATGRKAAPDPLFVLAGGPGQAATEAYAVVAASLARVNVTRDIVLVDQRGTGGSHALECPSLEIEGTTEEPSEIAAASRACLAALDADVLQYSTANAMDDLDDVRDKLGYARIDLYGASYGTRAALVYLRRHPEHVRAVVLDGVVPLPGEWALGASIGRDAQRAMDLVLERCAADDECRRAFPDVRASLDVVLSARDTPEAVVVMHPTTAVPTRVMVTRDTVASTLRALSYTSETAALLPLLLHTTKVTSDYRALAAQSLLMKDFMNVSVGLHLAVACSEDAPLLDQATLEAVNAGTYSGSTPGRMYLEACKGWPRAPLAPKERAPARPRTPEESDVPVLLLSGELDPVTPPSNAAAVARSLPNSIQITVPGEAHGVLTRSCVRRIVGDFLDRASTSGLSVDCVRASKPLRFFTSFAGPPP
jgi:pimeloyl-ACP methyl ester carboxylesterase